MDDSGARIWQRLARLLRGGAKRAAISGGTSDGTGPCVADDPDADTPAPADPDAFPAGDAGPALPAQAGPHAILDELTELRLELDARGRIVDASVRARELLGLPAAADRPPSLLEYLATEDCSAIVAAIGQARATPALPHRLKGIRMRCREADGSIRHTRKLQLCIQADATGAVVVAGVREIAHQPDTHPLDVQDDRFSQVFHYSPDGILIVRDEDAAVIDLNQGFTQLLGFTREQAIGMPEYELGLWESAEERARILATFRADRGLTDVETRLRSADGTLRWVEISMRYIELDRKLCVLCLGRDISKRVAAESQAQRSEEKFAEVFSHSPDGIMILSEIDQRIRDVNRAFLKASGFTAEELVGRRLDELTTVMSAEDLERANSEVAREGRMTNREMMFRSKTGQVRPTLVSANRINFDGEPSLMCIAKDVSELRQAQEQLLRSEERFRGTFENAPIGILLLDIDGHILEANRFAADMLAYPEGTLDNTHVSRLVPADERADLKEQLERLKRDDRHTMRTERRMLCGSGLEIWTNCHVVLQPGASGEPPYLIVQIADITEMKNSQRQMEELAFYDTLTRLANRRLFADRLGQTLEHCQRQQQRAALLYLDLDQFKRVNDTLGHEAGDALLREVADRLLRCVRKADTVGRPGGDEFTILLTDLKAAGDAAQVAEKILKALQQPINLAGQLVVVTTSIGITIIPDDGIEAGQLLKNADLAMYRAKEKGRNNYQFYSDALNVNAVKRLNMEYELTRAMERGEFELYYQPKVCLKTAAVVGVECLIRWLHPQRGMVPPDEFIRIAEETGAIVDIGIWIIETACATGRRMVDARGGPVGIAVNISPRQFRDPRLVGTIRRSLRQAGLDPACLELEITETMLMQDVEATYEIINRLHALGIRLAIDDFGTGYSSLNYLKKFPISTVKVDRSFISDIPASKDDMAITAAVIAMAHRLQMQVVAEGVETPEQRRFLIEQGCDFAQGYLYGRPQPLADTLLLLAPETAKLHIV